MQYNHPDELMPGGGPVFGQPTPAEQSPEESGRHTIIVVDDDDAFRAAIAALLSEYEVLQAPSGRVALNLIENQLPDLVLLDINMPEMSGIEVMAKLRAAPRTAKLPIVLVTSLDETSGMVDAFGLGATDYITKPVNPRVLMARVQAHLREASLRMRLEVQNMMLARLAAFDELTGTYNRRSMLNILDNEIVRSRRYGDPMSVLLLDLDRFKHINDHFGHSTGDELLRRFARRVLRALRTTDMLCRYGGEEFCIVMPEIDEAHATAAAERVRNLVASRPFRLDAGEVPLTVSIGVMCLQQPSDLTSQDLLKFADQALYAAKRGGRNCVKVYTASEFTGTTG